MSSSFQILKSINLDTKHTEPQLSMLCKPVKDYFEDFIHYNLYAEKHTHLNFYVCVSIEEIARLNLVTWNYGLNYHASPEKKDYFYRFTESCFLEPKGLFTLDKVVKKASQVIEESYVDQTKCSIEIHARACGHKMPSLLTHTFVMEADFIGKKLFRSYLEEGINPLRLSIDPTAHYKVGYLTKKDP